MGACECVSLVVASKQDVPGALASEALQEHAKLGTLLEGRHRACLGGVDGLREIADWLKAAGYA